MGLLRNRPGGSGHIELLDGSHRVWSTDGQPAHLLPASAWLTPALTVSFPDFVKRNAYGYYGGAGITSASAMSMTTILPGEYFPGAAGIYDLAETVLGTVPAGCNFIDVRVTLNRTKNPTDILYQPVTNCLPTQQTHLQGGSALLEAPPAWRRAMWIGLSGTNVVLRRYQSVTTQVGISWNVPNDNDTGAGGRRPGWTHGGGAGSENGRPVYVIEISSVADVNNINKRRGEAFQCSLVDTVSDFSSEWTGSAIIRPGYVKP